MNRVQGRLKEGCGRGARLLVVRASSGPLFFLCWVVLTLGLGISERTAAQEGPPDSGDSPPHVQQSPEQLQQLVAPIALYPDSLVAQILAASTFPEQVVEADRWVQGNPGLQGAALAQAIDQEPWDGSVKALTAFPAVLGNMDKNLSWTSSLGDAYYNQPQDVMAAVQVMRQRAEGAGTLKTTPQQVVTTQDSDVSIEPTSPDMVYVPAYDPWIVYGAPVPAWPGWYPYPGVWYDGPYLLFGGGFAIGFLGGFGWGWHHWGFDWHHRHVFFNHNPYFSRSTTFYNRGNFYRGVRPGGGFGGRVSPAHPGPPARSGLPAHPRPPARPGLPAHSRPPARPGLPAHPGQPARPGLPAHPTPPAGGWGRPFNSPGVVARPFNGSVPAARGYAAPRGESGIRSSAFSGYNRGGETRGFASRGSRSVGGGGAPRGGPRVRPRGHR